MSLTVKASLLKGNGNSDIRRFRLDEENINYKFLEKKINEIFPDSAELLWKGMCIRFYFQYTILPVLYKNI